MNTEFWKNKTVFVTGHTGFKGAWLCLWLHKLGANVVGYSVDVPTNPSAFTSLKLASKLQDMRADVRDLSTLKKTMQAAKPDIVFHLAAQALVLPGYNNPVQTYETNVMGTVNVLEAVRATSSVKACVVVTSDKCYKNTEQKIAYVEQDTLGGKDPYSGSKACAELVVQTYRDAFFKQDVAVATARAGNVMGGGDWAAHRLVPDVMRALQSGTELVLRNPNAVRPWQHVLEPISGYLLLAQKLFIDGLMYARAYNFGPSLVDCKPVYQVVQAMATAWPSTIKITKTQSEYHEAGLLSLNTDKAKKQLNWTPTWGLAKAVENTVAWYKGFYANADLLALTNIQIEAFAKASNAD